MTIDDQDPVEVDPDDLPDWPNWTDPDNGSDDDNLPGHVDRGPEPDDDEVEG